MGLTSSNLAVGKLEISKKNQISAISDTLRIPEKYQNYRHAKKTQISLEPKKYRYVGDTSGFKTDSKPVVHSRYRKFSRQRNTFEMSKILKRLRQNNSHIFRNSRGRLQLNIVNLLSLIY